MDDDKDTTINRQQVQINMLARQVTAAQNTTIFVLVVCTVIVILMAI